MKRFCFLIISYSLFSNFIIAQDLSQNAIGLRMGDSDGFGAEISYQRAINDINRIEADLGWRTASDFDGFKLTGIYQWVWEFFDAFNWYAGPGAGLGMYSYDATINRGKETETFLFIAGQIGVEYNFDIPLQLSLDFRPEIGFGNLNDDLGFDIALGVRYQF